MANSENQKNALEKRLENSEPLQAPVRKKHAGGRPPRKGEKKRRVSLSVLPSNYDRASKIASIEGRSLSQVVNDFLTEYVKNNREKIEEYDKRMEEYERRTKENAAD